MDINSQNSEAEEAARLLTENPTEQNLWDCIILFQSHVFYTATGLPFSYCLKIGKNGKTTKELIIDRRKDSKSLSYSSIRIAFEKVLESDRYFERPKAIGDIRGISYIYSMFMTFGLIKVPDKYRERMIPD